MRVRNRSAFANLLALVVASACAPLPGNLLPRPELNNPGIASAAPLSDIGRRPGEKENRWWESFRDAELTQLIDEALVCNPDLAAAGARLRAAQGAVRQMELDTGVQYAANATVQRARVSEHGFLPPPLAGESYNLIDVSLGVSYSLDWWGRNRALVSAAMNAARSEEAEQAAARLAVAALAADAYFALANAEAQELLAQQQVEKRRASLAIEQSHLDHGLASPYLVRVAEQALARAEDTVRRSGYEALAWRYRLAAATGRSPDQAQTLPKAQLPAPVALPSVLPLDWLARRPDVAAQRWRVQAAGDVSDATRAEFYPNVNLMLLVGLESKSASQLLSRSSGTGSLGAAVHIPAFNVNNLQNRLGTREAEYAVAVGEYNRTVLDAARQVVDSYAALDAWEQREAFQQRALKAADQVEALSVSRYRNGLTGRSESLGAEISSLSQRQSETETRAAQLRASVALFHALGGSWEPSQE